MPPVDDQVAAVLLEPVIVAVNCCVPPVSSEAEIGEMVTATVVTRADDSVTVTTAEADLAVSATLVAVTV